MSVQHLILWLDLPVNERETGISRGFGYVEFHSIEEATAAKNELNGTVVGSTNIRVDYAPAKRDAGRGGGYNRGGGGGRGGYGGGGGSRGRGSSGGRGGNRNSY